MRWTIAALPLLALAAPMPATAADRGAAAVLNDPAMQDRMAVTVALLVGALMRLNVGPLAEAVAQIDPDSPAAAIPADATLGEVTGRDPDYAERMAGDVRTGTRMAARAASALSAYAPVLKDMGRDLAAQWERERADTRR